MSGVQPKKTHENTAPCFFLLSTFGGIFGWFCRGNPKKNGLMGIFEDAQMFFETCKHKKTSLKHIETCSEKLVHQI